MNNISQPIKLLFTIALSSYTLLGNISTPLAIAQPTTAQKTTVAQVPKFRAPEPPKGPVPGGRIRGGATRGNNTVVCPIAKPDFTALVYNTQQEDDVTNVWGYTTLPRPSLVFYIPFPQESKFQTTFTLKEEEIDSLPDSGKSIYTNTIPLPKKPGIVSWTLPADAPELKVGKRYRWFLTINCDIRKNSLQTYVEGVIYRVDLNPELAKKLEKATLEDQVAIYADSGIWYEAIATLAQLRRKNPQSQTLKDAWRSLLKDAKLEDIAEQQVLSSR